MKFLVDFHDYIFYPTTIKYHPYNPVCFLIWSISEAPYSSIILICSTDLLKETKWWMVMAHCLVCDYVLCLVNKINWIGKV